MSDRIVLNQNKNGMKANEAIVYIEDTTEHLKKRGIDVTNVYVSIDCVFNPND